jgi:23S rRNA pseudouridine2605 synthase
MERLQKFLSRAGVASRRHAESLIAAGRVTVNGEVVTQLGSRVDAAKDLVQVDGRLVTLNPERRYFLFYKPPGVVTTMADPEGRPTISDYVQEAGGRVFPVGRLDYDAEGALLLTDDGELANKLMHPSHQVPRVYLAKVKGAPDEASLARLTAGVRLEDGMARAVEASVFEKAERNTWVKLVVTEGRQHLVKRLCAAIGHPVVRLYRPAHAGLPVQGLRPGELRALTADEVRRVKAAADGAAQPEPALSLPARRHGHAAPGFEPIREDDDSGVPSSQRARREGGGGATALRHPPSDERQRPAGGPAPRQARPELRQGGGPRRSDDARRAGRPGRRGEAAFGAAERAESGRPARRGPRFPSDGQPSARAGRPGGGARGGRFGNGRR